MELSMSNTYIARYAVPHPTDSTKIFPGGSSFELSKADLKDPWVQMQIEGKVFTPYGDTPAPAKKEAKKEEPAKKEAPVKEEEPAKAKSKGGFKKKNGK